MDKGYGGLMKQILSGPTSIVDRIKRRTADIIYMAKHVKIRVKPTTRCEVITFSSCCLVSRIRNSVLSGLSFNLSISIQFCTSRIQDSIDDTAAVSLG